MSTENEYMLGHHDVEWARLEAQHRLWRGTLLDALPALGIGPGSAILEAGCGSGVLLRDLAEVVGPGGRAVGIERDPSAVEVARRVVADQDWTEVRQGDLFQLEPAAGTDAFDLVVARWVVGWLPEQEEVLRRLATQLRPGGYLLIQDYDYDSIRVAPEQPGILRLFEGMVAGYALHGGDAYVATRLPQMIHDLGLELFSIDPHCKAGPPGSDVFRWVETFFRQHVHRLVADGVLNETEAQASLDGWDAAHATPGSVFFSPLVVNVVARRLHSNP